MSQHSYTVAPSSKFMKINKLLKEQYGFGIPDNLELGQITELQTTVESDLNTLKIKGATIKESFEVAKRVLMLEALKELREYREELAFYESPDYARILDTLCAFVVRRVEMGDNFENAMREAMVEYRSSPYLFDKDRVEEELCDLATSVLTQNAHAAANNMPDDGGFSINETTETEFERLVRAHKERLRTTGIVDPTVAKAAQARGFAYDTTRGGRERYAMDIDAQQAGVDKFAPKARIGEPGVDYEIGLQDYVPKKKTDDKEQRQQAEVDRLLAGKKLDLAGRNFDMFNTITEDESLVKKLRMLLETEVDEAEIIMSSKKIAAELQEMIEKVGRIQNERLPLITDQMRNIHGVDASAEFHTQTFDALQVVMDSLYSSSEQLNNMIQVMAAGASIDMERTITQLKMLRTGEDGTGDETADVFADTMSQDEEALEFDNIAPEEVMDAGDDLGRIKKESTDVLQGKVQKMRALVEKARKLKESKK